MPKNLLDDVIDDSNLKKRYKDQNKQFQHEQKIAEIDSAIAEYDQRKPKDVSWAEDYNNFYDTQKRVNAALLNEIINAALFEKLKVTADNVIALALEKQEKKNKIEHDKKLAALEREKELAEIKAEKDRIEAQAAAKLAKEKKEREEKEKAEHDRLLAIKQEKALDEKIKELDALILTLGKKKPNNFWCDDVKNVNEEIKRIPTKKRIQFSNLQKLEELNQIVKIYEDESELNDKLAELMSVSRHATEDLSELDKTLNLIENCKKNYFFQDFNPEKLRHEKIQLVYADHFETLKRILSTPKKEYASIVDDFYAESVDFVPKVDFKIDDFIPGFTKKWDSMYKIVKKISDKEKDSNKKAKGKASTKNAKNSKKGKAPAGTKLKASPLCYVFFFLTLLIGGAAMVFELLYAAQFFPFLADYLIYIEAGTAFLSAFFMLLCAKRVANFLIGLLFMATGTALVYLPFDLTLIGYGVLLGTSIAMFLNYTSSYYRSNKTIYTVLNTTMGVLPFFLASFKVIATYVPAGLYTNFAFVGISTLLFITFHMDLTRISYDAKFIVNLIFGLITSIGSIVMAIWAFNVAKTDPTMYFTLLAIAGMCFTHMIITCIIEEDFKGIYIGVTIGVLVLDAIFFCTVIPQLIA